ncbi:MAG: cell division protein FtsQ/DivIB, partial [Verrucomicrobiota bacterium]
MRLFSITRKNRRRDDDFVFAVRSGAHGSGGKATRVRWWVKPMVGLVALVAFGIGGRLGMQVVQDHWLHRIGGLAIRHIAVSREGLLGEDEVRRLTGVDPGRNALTVDLYQVRQSLLRHPRIEEARVEIEFPDVLRVSVRERVPVARLVLPPLGSAQAYYL